MDNYANITPIQDGLKINIRDYHYKELCENEDLQSKFQMNIKRLNRWWYSVYFKERNCEN